MQNKCFNQDYAYFYDLIYRDKEYGREIVFLKKLFRKHCSKKPRKILDLGCGTGNHAIKFIKDGYKVTGIDISKDMIKIAKHKLREINLAGKFLHRDIISYKNYDKFDTVISMFAVVNYITEINSLIKLFRNVYSALNSNGLFIFECWNAFKVQKNISPVTHKEIELNNICKLVRDGKINIDSLNQICNINYTLKLYKDNRLSKISKETHILRYYYPQEIKNYLSLASLKLINVYPSFRFGEITDEHFHLLYVAKK